MSDPNAPYRPPSALPPAEAGPDAHDRPLAAPPGYGGFGRQPDDSGREPLRAARRAAWVLLGFVALQLLLGAVTALKVLVVPLRQWYPPSLIDRAASQGLGESALQQLAGVTAGGCYFVLVIALLVLFAFVRRGSRGGGITALILVSLLTLLSGIQTVATLLLLTLTAAGFGEDAAASRPAVPEWTGYDTAGLVLNAALAATGVAFVVLVSISLSAGNAARRGVDGPLY